MTYTQWIPSESLPWHGRHRPGRWSDPNRRYRNDCRLRSGRPAVGDLGFAAIIVSMALGATLIRRAGDELSTLAATAEPGDPRLRALQQRLATLNIINVLVLRPAVWAMVFKPTL
jgi:hypothetical protein